MAVLIPGSTYQFHLVSPILLTQVPAHDYSMGKDSHQSIPANAVIGRIEEADETLVRIQVLAVVQAQEEVEIRYPPPDYFSSAVLSLANVVMAYPVTV